MRKSMQKRGASMQNQSILDKYRVKYDSFKFLENENMPLFHIALYSPPELEIEELHYHDALEVGYCLEGSGTFMIDEEIFSFSAPCATLIYPGQLHRAKSAGPIPSVWNFVTLSPKMLPTNSGLYRSFIVNNQSYPKFNLFHENDILCVLIHELIQELITQEVDFLQSAKGLLETILTKHNRFQKIQDSACAISNMTRVGPIINYISQNYQNDYSVNELAQMFNISTASLRRWFQEALGLSPLQYLHKVRMITASCLLIYSNLSVLEISLEVGYHSQSSFQRQFNYHFGCSPSTFIAQHQTDASY